MRKLKLSLTLLFLAAIAKADPIAVNFGDNTFYLPLQVVSITQLYSFDLGKGFPGAETVLISRGDLRLTAGAAPILGTSENVPFIGAEIRLSPDFFDISNNALYFGAWTGVPSNRDADESKNWTWGLKCSVAIW